MACIFFLLGFVIFYKKRYKLEVDSGCKKNMGYKKNEGEDEGNKTKCFDYKEVKQWLVSFFCCGV